MYYFHAKSYFIVILLTSENLFSSYGGIHFLNTSKYHYIIIMVELKNKGFVVMRLIV